LFELKVDYYHPDRSIMNKSLQRANKPTSGCGAFPRVSGENGQLDDIPWVEYVHHFDPTI